MAKQSINVGTTANDKKGDSLRAAFQKVNANFTELYTALGLNSDGTLNLGAFEFSGSTMSTTDSTPIVIDQSVTVSSDLTIGGDIVPSVANGGNLGSIAKPFKSLYVSNSTVYFGGVPLAINQSGQLTVNGSQVGGSVAWNDVTGKPTIPSIGDVTFTNSSVSAGNEDEIILQAKDTNGFATARLSLEPVYGTATLSAYSTETVETFTLANGDFASGIWQNNGFGNGAISFTGAQNIGDFFQNTLQNLTPENVSITVNSEPAFQWNGGTSGSGSSTPGFQLGPTLVPASPITITSITFRYRTQSKISVNQDNTEIRLTAQSAGIEMSADLNVRVFADSQIEIQSGDTLSISAGESINISNGSSDSISLSTGDLNFTAFDDVNFRGSDSFRLRNTSASAPIRIITDDNNTQQTWAFNPDGNLTLPGNLQSDSNINIEINLADSTKRIWRFGEDGELTFPNGTSQSGAGISANSSDTLTNKTINIQAGQGNVFQIQGNSITSYSGSGAVLALTSMPTFSGMNVNNSSLSIDGGTGSFYANTAFADGAGTIHKAGVYKSANNANNALFTFGANGAGTMSVVMDGSLFIGSALPANNGGLNTDYGGWLVVQAGAKFGGDLNTTGNFILDTPGNYVMFGDGTTQTTAYTGLQTSLVGAVDNNVLIRTSETIVTNNLYTNTVDFSTDVDIGGGTIISGWLQRNAEQIEISLFGPDAFRTYLTGLSLGRTVVVTYSTDSGNQTLTRPLTQLFASIAQEDPSNLGWYRVAGRIDATLPAGQTGIVSINFPVTTTPQRDWTFSDTGSFTFPDSTVQTTAFTASPTLNVLKIEDGVHEKFQTKSNATGTVTHDCSSGHIFYHTTPSANWTVNLTNLNLAVGYATTVTIVIEQGGTGYYPNALQIAGNAQPFVWQANTTPTPSTNRIDVVTFSILYDGLYTVLGQLTGF